jgi:hypothetical protein
VGGKQSLAPSVNSANVPLKGILPHQHYDVHQRNVLSCVQEYNNPDELAVRTTALTQLDADICGRAHQLCREYLRGAWKRITAQDLVIRKVRYISARRVIQ